MAKLPIDSTKITLVSNGKVRPEPVYAKQADGSNRKVQGEQAKAENGLPIWQVDVAIDDANEDPESRTEQWISVKVPASTAPVVRSWNPVTFNGLVCVPRVDWKNGNKLVMGMFADLIDQPASPQVNGAKSKSAASAASE